MNDRIAMSLMFYNSGVLSQEFIYSYIVWVDHLDPLINKPSDEVRDLFAMYCMAAV